MRKFGYTGAPLTCLWCGRKHREEPMEVRVKDFGSGTREALLAKAGVLVGEELEYRGAIRTVRESIPFVTGSRFHDEDEGKDKPKADRKAREGEDPVYFKVYFDPPAWAHNWGTDEPLFDTVSCGERFGIRAAELGYRLKLTGGE